MENNKWQSLLYAHFVFTHLRSDSLELRDAPFENPAAFKRNKMKRDSYSVHPGYLSFHTKSILPLKGI